MMRTWGSRTLQRVNFDSHTVLLVPDDWNGGYDEASQRFWCGPNDDDVTLFVQRLVSEDEDSSRAAARDAEAVAEFLGGLQGLRGEPEISVGSREETCIHAVIDHLEDGVTFRTFRWYVFRIVDPQAVAQVRFTLSMPAELSGEPANRELVELFASQIAAAQAGDPLDDRLWARAQKWRRLPESERVGCRLDWHMLRVVKPFGFLSVLAPESWPVNKWDPEAKMWCLCDEPADEVTLWVAYDVIEGIPGDRVDVLVDGMIRKWPPNLRDRGRLSREGGGFLLRATKMAEENGEMLRYFHWTAVAPISRGAMLVNFGLVISASSQDTPDEALLVRIFDEEIPRYEFREPPMAPSGQHGD